MCLCVSCNHGSVFVYRCYAHGGKGRTKQQYPGRYGDMGQGYSVKGTNSIGNLLAEELMQTSDELTEGAGYNIYSMEVENKIATVEYSALQDCILMVVIYDEAGTQLLGSGTEDILAEENQARVCIDIETMPTYFMVKVYMLDRTNMKPLNQEYSCPLYTEAMQKLLNSTVDDYQADRVLQLSNDRTTNFMVFEDSTIRVESDEYTNVVNDQGDGSYKVENSDSMIKELKVGDIVAIGDGENLTIIKVKSISVDGDIVIIKEDEVELEDVFSHVKLETFEDGENAVVDENTCPQGVTYVGDTKDEIPALTEKGKNVYVDGNFEADFSDGIKVKGNFKGGKKFEIDEVKFANDKATFKGDITLSLCVEFKLYLTEQQKLVEIILGLEGAINSEIKGDMIENGAGEIPFPIIYYPTPIGILFEVQPKILVEMNMKVNTSAVISGKIGFRYDTTAYNKMQGILDGKVSFFSASMEGNLGIGFGVEVSTDVVSEKLLKVGVLGAIMTRSQIKNNPQEYNHTCTVCFSGNTNIAFEAKPILKFRNKDVDMFVNEQTDVDIKVIKNLITLRQWYLSLDNFKFGFGECPYTENGVIPLELTVVDKWGKPIPFVDVLIEGTAADGEEFYKRYMADGDGKVYEPELPIGSYRVDLCKSGYHDNSRYIIWNNNKILPTMYLDEYENVYSEDIIVGEDSKVYELSPYRDGYIKELVLFSDNYTYPDAPFKNTSIGKVIIKDTVTKIPKGLFTDCAIKEMIMPDSVTVIEDNAFKGATLPEDFQLGTGVKEIGNYAFSGAKLPEKLELGANVNKVGSYAFWRTDVEIPCVVIDAETVLEEYAFSGITVGEVKLVSDATAYGKNISNKSYNGAFNGTQIGKISIEPSVTYIASYLFSGSIIQEITIPERIINISDYAFEKAVLPEDFTFWERESTIYI